MNTSVEHVSFRQRLRKFFQEFFWFSALRVNTVPVDENHLEGPRRVFFSPLTQASRILAMFQRDPNFVDCLPTDYEQHLVVLAVVGNELRANVYRLEENPHLYPSFNGQWMNQGLFPFVLNKEQDTVELLRRDVLPHLRYNPYFVEVSYARTMTQAEEEELQGTWLNSARRLAASQRPASLSAG